MLSKTPQRAQTISEWLDHFSSERGGTRFTPLSQSENLTQVFLSRPSALPDGVLLKDQAQV